MKNEISSVADVVDLLTPEWLMNTLGVTRRWINESRRVNEMPARWFHPVEKALAEKGYTVDRGLFNWAGVTERTP